AAPVGPGRVLLDPRLEPASGDVDGSGDVPFVPFLALADVEEDRRVGAVVELARAPSVDLVDLLPRVLQKFAIGTHCFPIYSDLFTAIVGTWTRGCAPTSWSRSRPPAPLRSWSAWSRSRARARALQRRRARRP